MVHLYFTLWNHQMYKMHFVRSGLFCSLTFFLNLSLSSVLVNLILVYEPTSMVFIIGPFQNDKVTEFSFLISVLLNSECWQG